MPLNSLGREPFQPGQAPAAWPLLAGGGSPRPCSRALLQVDVDKDRSLLLDWDRVRVFDREVAQMFLNMTRLEKEAQVGCSGPRGPLLTRVQGSLCLSGTQTPFREKTGCSHTLPHHGPAPPPRLGPPHSCLP